MRNATTDYLTVERAKMLEASIGVLREAQAAEARGVDTGAWRDVLVRVRAVWPFVGRVL